MAHEINVWLKKEIILTKRTFRHVPADHETVERSQGGVEEGEEGCHRHPCQPAGWSREEARCWRRRRWERWEELSPSPSPSPSSGGRSYHHHREQLEKELAHQLRQKVMRAVWLWGQLVINVMRKISNAEFDDDDPYDDDDDNDDNPYGKGEGASRRVCPWQEAQVSTHWQAAWLQVCWLIQDDKYDDDIIRVNNCGWMIN